MADPAFPAELAQSLACRCGFRRENRRRADPLTPRPVRQSGHRVRRLSLVQCPFDRLGVLPVSKMPDRAGMPGASRVPSA
jgi:hypothetical protein